MSDKQDLYDMDLHDELEIWNGFYARRVPGGWIYMAVGDGDNYAMTSTFVPMDNEFEEVS